MDAKTCREQLDGDASGVERALWEIAAQLAELNGNDDDEGIGDH